MSLNVVFTGGGTAGHVTPNIALINQLKQEACSVSYIGSVDGIERDMITKINIPFYGVSSGKLRRYFSLKNFIDPFKILKGITQSFFLLRRLKPDVVFSKGGFVAFPVVVGAWLNKIPIVAHESDMSPGLANKLTFPFVNKICLTFDAGKEHFKRQDKIEVTGTPIRQSLFDGDAGRGLKLCGFDAQKPCLLIVGGSQGASAVNQVIRAALLDLIAKYQVIHLCGKAKLDPTLESVEGYKQFEYVHEELADLFAASSVVISRSGANSLYEILALGKPHILIPLSAQVSRGDQIQNAGYFQKLGISVVIQEADLNKECLLKALKDVKEHSVEIQHKIQALKIKSATDKIMSIIKEQAHVAAL